MAGVVPEFNDTDKGPKAGSDAAIRDNWSKAFELRLPPRAALYNLPGRTDYQRRAIETLTVHVDCTSRSLLLGAELGNFLLRDKFDEIEMQAPDEVETVFWLPLGDHWDIEKILIVERGGGAARLQLTVKSIGDWEALT